MAHERFNFDDEQESLDTDLSHDNENSELNSNIDNSKNGIKMKRKKKTGKIKIKKWQIVVIAFLLMIIAFVVYVFIAGDNDGPVYGDRCASLIAIDQSQFDSIETAIEADGNINDVEIEVDCRIMKVSMNFIDNTTTDTAIQLATNALHTIDDTFGQVKEDGSVYSNLFGTANGRGQYNVEFVLTSNGDANFPIFGTKHPSSDEISFTGANVKDQSATDRATSTLQQ